MGACISAGRKAWVVVAGCALLFALVDLPPAARAAFPGFNGKIAYTYKDFETDSQSVCAVNRDGTGDTCLINGHDEDPAWLSSGARLVFSHGGDLATMNHDGTGAADVATTPEVEFEPTASPGGLQFAFTVDAGGPLQIHRIDSDGTDRIPLTSSPLSSEDPAWSPDGSKIAFARGGDLYTMNPDGTDQVNITNTPGAAESAPNWSPDGTMLAFARDGGVWRTTVGISGALRLTDGTDPAWSPDGNRIAFTRIDASTSSLRTVNDSGLDDLTVRTVPTFEAEFAAPDWQPTTFAYPRPAGATPFRVPLVPASEKCIAPNREHGPPLAFGSCAPPVGSPNLTAGVGDGDPALSRSVGSMRFAVIRGVPGSPDDSDVRTQLSLSNVMRVSDLSEYTGELRARVNVRLTDLGTGSTDPQTTQVFAFEFDVPCLPTTEPLDKSLCSTTTSIDSVIPGAVAEGRRSIWALDQVKVYDGGPDEDADTTADNSLFAVQGVFIP